MGRPINQLRAELSAHLRARRPEIEQAVLTRVHAVSDPTMVPDPRYVDGLRIAVSAAIEYGLASVEYGEERGPLIPTVLLAQARIAARNKVSLDVVLRRYLAGYTLLDDHLISAAHDGRIDGASLQLLLRNQAVLFDRLFTKISEEHTREMESRPGTSEQQRTDRIKRLLDGELLDVSELTYPFDATHLGVIAAGPDATGAMRRLAKSLDRRLLSIQPEEGIVWAWLGGQHKVELGDLQQLVSAGRPTGVIIAIGEPGEGLSGWRLTHRQARAALPIARRRSESFTRYADVALLATVLQDDLLAVSLRELYLAPLERKRDGGKAARETLRAYFAASRNVSSAAAALGLSRRAVAKRLCAIEVELDCSLNSAALEIEAALRFQEFDVSHVAMDLTLL